MISVLVLSCDKYSFLWDGWAYYWRKHWDQDWPVYFVGETKAPEVPGVTPILCGTGKTWSEMLLEGVERAGTQCVMPMLEDFWLVQGFPSSAIQGLGLITEPGLMDGSGKWVCDQFAMRVAPDSKYYETWPDPSSDWRHYSKTSQYLASCQPTVWPSHRLAHILRQEESPWEFEIRGTERMRESGLSVMIYPHKWYEHVYRQVEIGGIKQGVWLPEGLQLKSQMDAELALAVK